MNVKDILAKVSKGETLTDEEKQFLAKYDVDKASNDAAAAARRKAEESQQKAEKERDDLKKKVENLEKKIADASTAGQTDQEKSAAQIKALSDQIEALSKRLESSDKEKAALSRNQAIDALRSKNSIAFIDGVDETAMSGLFRSAFEGIKEDQLGDEAVVNGVLNKFKESFKGIIRDLSGHGAGTSPHLGGGSVPMAKTNPWKKDTFNLTEQAKLMKKDPSAAKRLASEVGVTLANTAEE